VAGSLAPDFHYFLDLGPGKHFSHSLVGAFVYCLPVALALLWIFHTLMKLPLISLAPEAHQQRLIRFATPFVWGPPSRFLLILAAILVGIFSHLAWDAFTHSSGFVVRNVPDLRAPALEEWGTHRPLFNMLQHVSSVLGIVILAIWYWRWFKRTPPQPAPANLKLKPELRWWITGVALSIAGIAAMIDAYYASDELVSRSFFVGAFVVTFMSVVLIEMFCFSVWWMWRKSGHRVIGSSGDRVIHPSSSDDPMSRSPDQPISL
jgi:hypothetical protein